MVAGGTARKVRDMIRWGEEVRRGSRKGSEVEGVMQRRGITARRFWRKSYT